MTTNTINWLLTTLEIEPPPATMALKAVNVDTGLPSDYKELLHSSDGHHWSNSFSNELGRLAQG